MALVRAESAKSKPESTLVSALDDFKTILTDEQSRQFNATLTPDANDAVRLATQIDRKNTNRWGRCLGPRLISFLESVQQFSDIVGTLVSSNPAIAALVWGGVKLSLLLVNNFASYFDKLSDLFMQLGRSCPRFVEFGALYKTSLRLQTALCEYYAVVVRLCKLAIEFARKPFISQTATAILRPFKIEFGPFEKQLLDLSLVIRDEVSLASKKAQDQESKLQVKERRMASRHRILNDIFQKQVSKEQMEARLRARLNTRLRVLNLFSAYNYQKAWKHSRRQCLRGTSSWIFEKTEWKDWLLHTSSASLCCTGTLGSGKTVITACVAAHLLSESSGSDVVSYFFCRYDDPESLIARTIIGSIARQLLSVLPLDVFTLLDRDIRDTRLDLEMIFEIFASRLTTDHQHFIVLDGLNEVGDTEIKEIFQFLERLLDLANLKIKVFYSDQAIRVRWLSLRGDVAWHIAIDQTNVTSDINYYVRVVLEQHLEDETLQLGDPSLILLIQKALIEGAKGVFLWVVFQIENICAQQTDEQILEAIQDLPEDLSKIFERILKKLVVTRDVKIASRIFNWLAVAKRPLTLEELREAIAIDPLQKELITARLVNDMLHALSCCGPLVIVDEEQGTVHFTHPSVRHHLALHATDPLLADYHVDLKAADARAGEVCITYLNFDVFDQRLVKAPTKGIETVDIPREIIRGMLPRTSVVNKLTAIKLLKDKNYLNRAVHRQIDEASQATQQHFFLSYGRKWWIFHTKEIRPTSKRLWDMWCRMLTDENCNADKPWSVKKQSGDLDEEMLDWAALNSHEAMFVYIMRSNELNHGELSAVAEYQLSSKIVRALVGKQRWTALCRFLELRSRSVNALHNYLWTELLIPAVWYGQAEIVQSCLTHGADMNRTHYSVLFPEYNIRMENYLGQKHSADRWGLPKKGRQVISLWSPLGIAAAAGNFNIIDLIMSMTHPKDALCALSNMPQALLIAAAFGQFKMAHYLLQLEQNDDDDVGHEKKIPRYFPVDEKDNNGWTALMYMIAWGNLELVDILLHRRANPAIEAITEGRKLPWTPLSIAESIGREDMKDLLHHWLERRKENLTPLL